VRCLRRSCAASEADTETSITAGCRRAASSSSGMDAFLRRRLLIPVVRREDERDVRRLTHRVEPTT